MKRPDTGRWKRRAYFTSYINAYPFLEAVRRATDGIYQGFSNGRYYIVMWEWE